MNDLPVPQILLRAFAVPWRLHAAEDGHCHRVVFGHRLRTCLAGMGVTCAPASRMAEVTVSATCWVEVPTQGWGIS